MFQTTGMRILSFLIDQREDHFHRGDRGPCMKMFVCGTVLGVERKVTVGAIHPALLRAAGASHSVLLSNHMHAPSDKDGGATLMY